MRSSAIALAVAITAVGAQKDCPLEYTQCITDGWAEVKCSCDRTACYGELAARIDDWCASATANITAPTKTSSTSVVTGTPSSQPSGQPPITAPEGSLPLGATCSDKKQCANGADCHGTTASTIRVCGNFNAACTEDSQCAYNTCSPDSGLCSGFLPSESYLANTASRTSAPAPTSSGYTTNGGLTRLPPTTSAPSASSTIYSCNPAFQYPAGQVCTEIGGQLTLVTGGSPAGPTATATVAPPSYGTGNSTGVAPTGTGAIKPSSSLAPYQGAASVVDTLSGLAALVAGVVAYVL